MMKCLNERKLNRHKIKCNIIGSYTRKKFQKITILEKLTEFEYDLYIIVLYQS